MLTVPGLSFGFGLLLIRLGMAAACTTGCRDISVSGGTGLPSASGCFGTMLLGLSTGFAHDHLPSLPGCAALLLPNSATSWLLLSLSVC